MLSYMLSRPMSRLAKTAVDLRFRFQALPLLALKCLLGETCQGWRRHASSLMLRNSPAVNDTSKKVAVQGLNCLAGFFGAWMS